MPYVRLISVKGFNLAAFGNPLSKSAYVEVVWEISNLQPANIVEVALHALDGYEQWPHYFHQIPGRNPFIYINDSTDVWCVP